MNTGKTTIYKNGIRPSKGPGLATMVYNLGVSAAIVGKAMLKGEPIVASKPAADARLTTCRACPAGHWNEAGNMGFGKCMHPKCGCTKCKTKFLPLKCPEGFWK